MEVLVQDSWMGCRQPLCRLEKGTSWDVQLVANGWILSTAEGPRNKSSRGDICHYKVEETFDHEQFSFRSLLEWVCLSERPQRRPIRKPQTIFSAPSGWITIEFWLRAARGGAKTSISSNVGCVTTNTPRLPPC
jgi:hypothetical protein